MDDLRSLEGVGQLLQRKLNHKRHCSKLRSRYRTTTVHSPATPSTPSTISDYFPPDIANILGNAIQSGYHCKIPSAAPMLRKSHSALDYRNDIPCMSAISPSCLSPSSQLSMSSLPFHDVEEEEEPIFTMNLPTSATDPVEFPTFAVPDGGSADRGDYDGVRFPHPQNLQQCGKMNSIDNLCMDEDDYSDLEYEYNPNSVYPVMSMQPIHPSDTNGMMQLIQPQSMTTVTNYCAIDSPGCPLTSPSVHSPSLRFPPPGIAVDAFNPLPSDESDREILIAPLHGSDRGASVHRTEEQRDTPSVAPLQLMRADGVRSISSTASTSGSGPPPFLRMQSNEMNMLLSAGDTTSCSVEPTLRSPTNQREEEVEAEYVDLKKEYMRYPSWTQNNGLYHIGHGASGIVCKEFHYKSCQMVAIKHCRSRQIQEMTAFSREAAIYHRFADHPNIINMQRFLCDEDTENLCIALEFMDLGSTDKLRMNEIASPHNRELAVSYVIGNVLRALEALHAAGYVHNDIKPANILCNKYGDIKLSDFGTMKQMKDARVGLTKNCGTQKYQAPEKVMNCTQYTTKADIWSVGISCFELLFGPRSDGKELSYVTNPPLLSPEQHNVTPLCCDFLRQCLAMNEECRPTAQQLLCHEWILQNGEVALKSKWPWLVEVDPNGDGEGDEVLMNDEDLLFMIGSLVCYYSKQSVDFQGDKVESSRLRRSAYTDQQRLFNMARYALCSTKRVVQRIRVTVAYIKSCLHKADISRIDS